MDGITVDANLKELILKLKKCDESVGGQQMSRQIINFAAEGLQIIRKEALANLRSSVRIRGYSRSSIKYGKMDKGIKIVKGKVNSLFPGRIHIMGDYRLKWFERGTQERYKKHAKSSSGSIKATHFFSKVSENPARVAAVKNFMIQKMEDVVSRLLESIF
jgi:hypothetical protein